LSIKPQRIKLTNSFHHVCVKETMRNSSIWLCCPNHL